ncbi:uncharacterized protein LOC111704226 [Eurytemora carolleeae]|uniref:uncharacterized protein LOC111704226 n=1 Tax=Eurytemora carolleeae TaxID=1294199 RepID=UPI000C76CA6E|nr:uncharacterized protein LOC111704226 [Eurytemora carolleeae]|eukprot:XP_023332148.1 uncharacterized protein LOC111704226 [Eurytemora affinis]
MAEQTTEEKEECDPLRRFDYQRLSGVSSSSCISNCSSKRSRDGCSVLSDPRLSQLFHITQSLGKMADEFPEVCGERNINAEYPDQNKCKDALSELDKLNDDILRLTPGLRYSSMSDKRPSSSLGESCTPSPDLRGEEDIWKTRCIELEESLGRFRDQANRIRDILQIKLSDLENRVEDSESRADTAEQKVQILIRRLEEIDWTPSEISQQAETFQKLVMEKETIIKSLESEVESQDWVTNKLRELEEQNTHLKQQNAYCNQQMELLRAQLERMQEDRRTRDSLEVSFI